MGYCGTCKYRVDERCTNSKLDEDYGLDDYLKQDMLIYDHNEGGGFWVGPKFGCVHYRNCNTSEMPE